MTTHYTARNAVTELNDLVDKHVPLTEARLVEHYAKAEETRALLKRLGSWPTSTKVAQPPRKKPAAETEIQRAKRAYEWATATGSTTMDASDKFRVSSDAIHSYRQYRKLPTLSR